MTDHLKRMLIAGIACLGLLGALPGLSLPAAKAAENYPSELITVVVPFPPGGAADTFARLVSEHFERVWGQPSVVDNRPGGGGIVATRHVVGEPADGYTFLIVTVGHAVNPSLHASLPYDTTADLVPVAMVARLPNMMVVRPDLEVDSVEDLIAMAQDDPGGLTYASSGNATTSHVAGALFTSLTGVDMLHVPYGGSAPARTDLIGGHVDMMIDPVLSASQHVEAGQLKALAVTTTERSALVPDLPTMAEAGVEGYDFAAWFMLLAPAGTPADIIEKVNAEIAEMVADEAIAERLAGLGAEPVVMTPDEVAAFLDNEIARYAQVVEDADMKLE